MRTPLVVLCLLTLVPAVARSAASIQARGGIEIVAVTSSVEGALLALEDRRGDEVSRGITDRFGSYLFTEVKPGPGYVVRNLADGSSQTVTVLDFKDHPAQSFYEGQTLKEGYNYIQMRDGTLLAAMVRAPLGRSLSEGPFPTVIEYSGYDPANPDARSR